MKRALAAFVLVLSWSNAASASAAPTPLQVPFPQSVTGIPQPRYLTVSNGLVWVVGDTAPFKDSLLSCIDVATQQRCAGNFPVLLTDDAGIKQANPKGVGVDRSGRVWVVNQSDLNNFDTTAGSVSRFTPAAGTAKTFVGGVEGPQAMTVGAEGDIWVANSPNTISRIDPATGGLQGGYPLATGATAPPLNTPSPSALTAGKDGTIWVAIFDSASGQKARVTRIDPIANAVVGGYPKLTGGSRDPQAITVGADGDIWINNDGGGTLSRLIPATGANRPGYPLSNGSSSSGGMATGTDGSIWLTTSNNGKLSRFDPETGSLFPDYPITIGTTLGDVAVDGAGNPWVTVIQTGNSRVVELALDGVAPAPSPSPTPTPTPTPIGDPGPAAPAVPISAPLAPLADRAAPKLELTGKKKQKAGPSISVTVNCADEACTASVAAKLELAGSSSTLPKVTRQLSAGAPTSLKLTLSKKLATAARKSAARRKAKLRVVVTASDAAGNAATSTRVITLTS